MVDLQQLIDADLLAEMIAQGYIRERRHAQYPYRILNYTERAQWERVWNEATTQCRGLVVDDNDTVIARPFAKFHNHDEHGAALPTLSMDAPVRVTDKLDGSLGILVPTPDRSGHVIATRGSFDSEQARWATRLYRERYAQNLHFAPDPQLTYMFEIVYKANRIVVDYDFEDLVLIGIRHNETGIDYDINTSTWPGRKAFTFDAATLADALAMQPRDNAEGVVVTFRNTGARVKIKQADYIELHRIATGLSERVVWDHMMAGAPIDALIEKLPDEFHGWIRDVTRKLQLRYMQVKSEMLQQFDSIPRTPGLPPSNAKKEFALAIAEQPEEMRALLYPQLQIELSIWQQLRPEGDTRMWNSEDAA